MREIATLAGGCFWCVEAVYVEMKGVDTVASGYMGGQIDNPTYEQICTGRTGHAEVIQIEFDPAVVNYEQILQVFFTVHDPTTLNRQGNDVGTQYRSAIFYHSEEQKLTADKVIKEFTDEEVWPGSIVTEVTAAPVFYPAENYHKDYYARNQYQPYCMVIISPKLAKFRAKFKELQKSAA